MPEEEDLTEEHQACDLCGFVRPVSEMDLYVGRVSGTESFECHDHQDCSLRRIANAVEALAGIMGDAFPQMDVSLAAEEDKERMN